MHVKVHGLKFLTDENGGPASILLDGLSKQPLTRFPRPPFHAVEVEKQKSIIVSIIQLHGWYIQP